MIAQIVASLQDELRLVGCPIPVVRREEDRPPAQTFARERIVVELGGQDRYTAAKGAQEFGAARRAPLFRQVAVTLRIYAREPKPGAVADEHFERAAKVIDTLIPALDKVIRGQNRTTWSIDGGAFFVPDDLDGSQRANGAAYELRISIERGIYAATWKGEGPNTVAIGTDVTFTNTLRVNGEEVPPTAEP